MNVVLNNTLEKKSNYQQFKGDFTPLIIYGFFSLQKISKRAQLNHL